MTRTNDTTERIMRFIRDYVVKEGIPPTVREIKEGCALSSTSLVAHHLDKLEAAGRIRRKPGAARSIRVEV